MAETQSVALADAALKTLYPGRAIKSLAYKNHPLLAMIPKDEKFVGKNMAVVTWFGGNVGRSRTFATAQANATAGKYEDFILTRVKDYGITYLELEAILASASDEGAFLSLAKSEIDNLIRNFSHNLSIALFRNKGGARGTVGAINSGVLTLANAADVVNFEIGMVLKQSTTDGTSGALGSGTATITGVNRSAGTLTASAWTNFSVADFLFQEGDFGGSISGIAGWIPFTAPTGGDNFFGVDRSVDTRLYGQRHDATGQDIVEGILDLDTKLMREGARPDYVVVNPDDFNVIRKTLGSDVIFDKAVSPEKGINVSFDTIAISGQSGMLKVLADPTAPVNFGYVLQLDSWKLCSLGSAPRSLNQESVGHKFLSVTNADAVEVRIGMYGNLACWAPGYNGVVRFR